MPHSRTEKLAVLAMFFAMSGFPVSVIAAGAVATESQARKTPIVPSSAPTAPKRQSAPALQATPTTRPALAVTPKIVVTSPAAGQKFIVGGALAVAWSKVGSMHASQTVKISHAANPENYLVTHTVQDTVAHGHLNMKIPDSAPAGKYRVIVTTEDRRVSGASAVFDITPGRVEVTAPTAVTPCWLGKDMEIAWRSDLLPGSARVTIHAEGNGKRVLVGEFDNSGRAAWKVPSSLFMWLPSMLGSGGGKHIDTTGKLEVAASMNGQRIGQWVGTLQLKAPPK